MADGRWPMADGRWPMADGRWPMADGRWPMADGARHKPRAKGARTPSGGGRIQSAQADPPTFMSAQRE